MSKIINTIAAKNRHVQTLANDASINIYKFLQSCGYNSLGEYIHGKIDFHSWIVKEVLNSNG